MLNQYLADIESGAYTKEEAYQKALAEGASSEEARDKAVSAAETEVLYTQWTNKAITSTYEPGSTFKSIVLAAAWRRAWSPRTATSTAPATSW